LEIKYVTGRRHLAIMHSLCEVRAKKTHTKRIFSFNVSTASRGEQFKDLWSHETQNQRDVKFHSQIICVCVRACACAPERRGWGEAAMASSLLRVAGRSGRSQRK